MPQPEGRRVTSGGVEKRGGYSGSKPASQMRPPAKVPSGMLKPSATPKVTGKKAS